MTVISETQSLTIQECKDVCVLSSVDSYFIQHTCRNICLTGCFVFFVFHGKLIIKGLIKGTNMPTIYTKDSQTSIPEICKKELF